MYVLSNYSQRLTYFFWFENAWKSSIAIVLVCPIIIEAFILPHFQWNTFNTNRIIGVYFRSDYLRCIIYLQYTDYFIFIYLLKYWFYQSSIYIYTC